MTATVLAPLVPALFSVRIEHAVRSRAITVSMLALTPPPTEANVCDAPSTALPVLLTAAYAFFATICTTTSTLPTPVYSAAAESPAASTVIPRRVHAPPVSQALTSCKMPALTNPHAQSPTVWPALPALSAQGAKLDTYLTLACAILLSARGDSTLMLKLTSAPVVPNHIFSTVPAPAAAISTASSARALPAPPA